MNADIRKGLAIRFGLSFVISFIFAFIISEGSYRLLNNQSEREPREYVLIIPAGTSERVSQGLPIPSIPEDMIFYEGDLIVVQNDDETSHQLGPIWVQSGLHFPT